ncbi:uncharacterized protein F4807DRAFT_160965 [Annulohypoxylon truncatum]|uniref:uncharacterized protein n=1 Tax=Annulohypoxylon truncatum TaxID=327061 RepID=UPI0020076090|nr:uncharacterized protein F4807DRAFT_160965 [Annulohypoxylon truncatum]KAI1207980.1 hypothetical protein F4807DRAFT_160965 [Annulohypoxylon truncatum]
MSKALILAGKLKPEVRLGVILSEFSEALDDKHRKRFIALRAAPTAVPTAADVIRVTEELNRQGAELHRAWRPYSTRLGTFLSRLQSLASVGDVIIGGSQNLIASGVWFAVRICLEVRSPT